MYESFQQYVPAHILIYNTFGTWFLSSVTLNSLGFVLLSLDIGESEGIRVTGALMSLFGVLLQAWNCVYLGLIIRYLHRRKQPIMELIMMELFQIVFFALTIAITVQAFNFI